MGIIFSKVSVVGGFTVNKSTTSVTPGGGTVYPGQNPDGGFYERTSIQTYTADTKLNTIYPSGTRLVTGEFDDPYAGFQDQTYTITDDSTIADLIAAFNHYFALSAVDDAGNPVDFSADPTASFHLRATSTDGGSYDVVYGLTPHDQRHANKLFDPDAVDQTSENSFDYITDGDTGGSSDDAYNDRVGTVFLHEGDLLTTVSQSAGTKHLVLTYYANRGDTTPLNVYRMDNIDGITLRDMITYFSTRRSEIMLSLQQVPGTDITQEGDNTEGYLHIVAATGYVVLTEQNSDYSGSGAPTLLGTSQPSA